MFVFASMIYSRQNNWTPFMELICHRWCWAIIHGFACLRSKYRWIRRVSNIIPTMVIESSLILDLQYLILYTHIPDTHIQIKSIDTRNPLGVFHWISQSSHVSRSDQCQFSIFYGIKFYFHSTNSKRQLIAQMKCIVIYHEPFLLLFSAWWCFPHPIRQLIYYCLKRIQFHIATHISIRLSSQCDSVIYCMCREFLSLLFPE